MPYQITHFSGTPLVTVDDGTIDQTTDLRLVGKNYAGYGAIQNDNYVYLLENFANSTSPPKAIPGQLWYDNGTNKLKFYDKNLNWRTTGGTTTSASASPPTGLTSGDLWYTTDKKQLYVFNADQTTTLIGPQSVTGAGQAGLETVNVLGTDTLTHTIILGYINGSVDFIMSGDSFTLNSVSNPIAGFTDIVQGITLVDSATGITTSGFRFRGTASNSESLNGVSGNNYATKNSPTFTGTAHFPNTGLTVGTDNNDLLVFIDTNANRLATIQNQYSSKIAFKVKDTSSSTVRIPLVLDSMTVVPGVDSVYDLGTSLLKWNNVWVGTVHSNDLYGTVHGSLSGTADKSNTLLLNGIYVSAASTATANTIMARDGNASTAVNVLTAATVNATNVTATTVTATTLTGTATKSNTLFYARSSITDKYSSATDQNTGNTIVARDVNGSFAANVIDATANRAKYADLAEKYDADSNYEPGTVVVFGGDFEITTTSIVGDTRVAGAISTDPAYLMNNDSEGLPVALRGKIPVKVIGKVSKGDCLVTSSVPGYAMVADLANVSTVSIFAKSLEDKNDTDLGTIMAVVL
jgi:hypothetical protein